MRAYDLHCAPKTWRPDSAIRRNGKGPEGWNGWMSLVNYRDLRALAPEVEAFASDQARWDQLEKRDALLRKEAPPKCPVRSAGTAGARCRALGNGITHDGGRPSAAALRRGLCIT